MFVVARAHISRLDVSPTLSRRVEPTARRGLHFIYLRTRPLPVLPSAPARVSGLWCLPSLLCSLLASQAARVKQAARSALVHALEWQLSRTSCDKKRSALDMSSRFVAGQPPWAIEAWYMIK